MIGNEARDELVREVLEARWRIFDALHARSAHCWRHLDLSMAQMKALVALIDGGPMTIGQVAEALGVSLPTASHLVERLVQAGFVERADDPADRRRAVARATPKAEELVGNLRHGDRSLLRRIVARLDDEDLAALARGMQALARAVVAEVDGAEADERRPAAERATTTQGD